jgi:predicted ATPase
LPEPARDLLKIASVLGSELTVAELAAVAGRPAGQLMSALGQALPVETIVDRGNRLAFRHDLFRQAVYQGLPASLRQALASRRGGRAAPLRRASGTGGRAVRGGRATW